MVENWTNYLTVKIFISEFRNICLREKHPWSCLWLMSPVESSCPHLENECNIVLFLTEPVMGVSTVVTQVRIVT